jgi:hypothetical protein
MDAQDFVRAEKYFREALAEAEQLGMAGLATHIRTNLGRVRLGCGESGMAEFALALSGALQLRSKRQITNVLEPMADEWLRNGDIASGLRAIGAALASPACSADVRAYIARHLAQLAGRVPQEAIDAALRDAAREDLEPVAQALLAQLTTASAAVSAP